MIETRLKTPPAVEPVTLSDAKAHAKVEVDDDDALIATYIQAAREMVEVRSSRALIDQVWEGYLGAFPDGCGRDGFDIVLPHSPLSGVASIKYEPAALSPVETLDPSVYRVDTAAEPGRIRLAPGQSWPAAEEMSVVIEYTAGYGDGPAKVPAALRQAILVLVADMYDNRSPVPTANARAQMEALVGPYIVGRLL